MIEILALITWLLSATVLGNPVDDFHQCTLRATSNSDVVQVGRFDGSALQYDVNQGTLSIIGDDLGGRRLINAYAIFDRHSPYVLDTLSISYFINFTEAHVKAYYYPHGFDMVSTIDFDSNVTETLSDGSFNVLGGMVKYAVNSGSEDHSINFVINENIFIDVLVASSGPNAGFSINIKQSSVYDHGFQLEAFGVCTRTPEF